jgi:hypothetical protein
MIFQSSAKVLSISYPLRHLRVEKLAFRSPHFAKRGWALLVASMAYLKEIAYIET